MKKVLLFISILVTTLTTIYLVYSNTKKVNNNLDNNKNNSNYLEDNKDLSDFKIDEVYHSSEYGDIHYSVYIPSDYDSSKSYPLYITLPGYEGLYFQGVEVNLKYESFATEALKINKEMFILVPQLNDWGDGSANETIALIEYYKNNFNINKVYANGYSGGGETMSLVMGKRADLIDVYLQVSSKWDGEYNSTVENKTPVYFVIGKDDEYYGSSPTINAYNTLYSMYENIGLSKEEIDNLLVLDIKEKDYFSNQGINNEHAGGGLITFDTDIMTWLLTK